MICQFDFSAGRRCACGNIRRTDRVVTQLFDTILAPTGLNSTQFGLLIILSQIAPASINRLAEMTDTDRTTITRNLGLLVKAHLVTVEEGTDRRVRLVTLAPEGEQALERAWPLWQKAQACIERALGPDRLDTLFAELAAVRDAAREAAR